MPAHLSGESIERYKQRRLPAAELLAADDHLAECEICRNLVKSPVEQSSFVSLRAGLRSEAGMQPQHVPFELLAAYVDDVADDVEREIAQSHLELCAACADEAQDLRAFRAEMQVYTEKDSIPIVRSSLREKFLAFWRAPGYRIPIQVASLVAMALLISSVSTFSLRREVADLRAQMIDLQRANDGLAESQNQAENSRPLSDEQRAAPAEIAVAIYDDEALITMDRNGNLSGLELSTADQERVRAALTGQLAAPDLEALSRKRGTLLGPSPGVPFALVSPVGIVTQQERPSFRWRPLAGAVNYVVQVFDASFTRVMASTPLTVAEWTPSAPLDRGRIYSWQVVANINGKEVISPEPPAPEAKFKVLEQSQALELTRVKQEHRQSHLVLGVAYAQAGLLDEAESEFRTLVNANPKSPAAERLLRRIQALRAAK